MMYSFSHEFNIFINKFNTCISKVVYFTLNLVVFLRVKKRGKPGLEIVILASLIVSQKFLAH